MLRLEIIIPDSTLPDVQARLVSLSKRLSDRPELVNELVDERTEGMPDYQAAVDQIRQSPNRFKSSEEIDAYIRNLRAEW